MGRKPPRLNDLLCQVFDVFHSSLLYNPDNTKSFKFESDFLKWMSYFLQARLSTVIIYWSLSPCSALQRLITNTPPLPLASQLAIRSLWLSGLQLAFLCEKWRLMGNITLALPHQPARVCGAGEGIECMVAIRQSLLNSSTNQYSSGLFFGGLVRPLYHDALLEDSCCRIMDAGPR